MIRQNCSLDATTRRVNRRVGFLFLRACRKRLSAYIFHLRLFSSCFLEGSWLDCGHQVFIPYAAKKKIDRGGEESYLIPIYFAFHFLWNHIFCKFFIFTTALKPVSSAGK